MRKLLLIILSLLLTALLWSRQHTRRQFVLLENDHLAANIAELQLRAQKSVSARQAAEQRFADLREQLRLRETAAAQSLPPDSRPAPPPPPAPDPSHQGGWPQSAGFFYLPKQFLTNVNYKLLNGAKLTDEAAALLGMSAGERAATDQLFGELLGQFRKLELERMERVAVPQDRESGLLDLMRSKPDYSVSYRIPAMGEDVTAAREQFSQQLQQVLGPSRAQLLEQSADSHVRQNVDGLGASDRVITFISAVERDGSHSLWYGIDDAIHGEGGFQRVSPDLDPNSQIAYYANLFGVRLPGKQ